jgi:xanthine dehydrogenase accessory factor
LKILENHQRIEGAIATVIKVEGSSYRHQGAKMLFLKNGLQFGLISGGCLEEDLKIHADETIDTQLSKTLTYDLQSEDDLDWGQGAGCNGKITVLLEPMKWNLSLSEVKKELESGRNIVSMCGINGEFAGMRLYYTVEGKCFGYDSLDMSIIEKHLFEFNRNEQLTAERYIIEYQSMFLFELYECKEKLYVFGAGPDVEPIVRRAAELDFIPIVIDPRESRCQSKYFPDASLLVCEHPEKFLAEVQIEANSFILIMTHSFKRDQQLVSYFLDHQPKYLGVLGPKRRTERLLYPEKVPEWFHSPIGLEIDAEGAEEISISIMAELIKVRNQKRAVHKWRKRINSTAV